MLAAMGAGAFAERARRELLATGEIVHERTTMQVSALTAQEAHIARLAADGHTNPEIAAQLYLSVRTAEWHLRKVFTKLGIGSRRELHEALPAVPDGSRTGTMVRSVKRLPLFRTGSGFASAAPRPRSGRRTRDGDFGKGGGYCR